MRQTRASPPKTFNEHAKLQPTEVPILLGNSQTTSPDIDAKTNKTDASNLILAQQQKDLFESNMQLI